VPLLKTGNKAPDWDADACTVAFRLNDKRKAVAAGQNELLISYRIIPWNRFRTVKAFDYILLSRSPGFTPPASDALVKEIEKYMKLL